MKKIKNICMLSTHGYFDPIPELGKTDTGGQVLYILHLARAISRLDINVDIYTRWFDKGSRQIDALKDCPRVRVIRIPAGKWTFIPKESIYGVLDELSKNMIDFIIKHSMDYDLFHGHYVDGGMVALKVAKRFSRPSFFTAHSLGAWKRQRIGGNVEEMDRIFNFKKRIKEETLIFKSVTGQTITSMEEKLKIKELYDVEISEVAFTPPGVNIDLFRPLRIDEMENKTDFRLPERYIFVVSRIAKAKGHDLLLPAFGKVMNEFPWIHLVIAGGAKNPDEEETEVLAGINRFIRTHKMERNVHVIGGVPHESLPPYYRQAQFFILPARYEPFGMTALEAMACRTPAVISKFSGIAENLNSGVDCLIVDPFDTSKYARTLKNLLTGKKEAKMLAKKGHQMVINNFSWQAIARKLISFYRKF